MRWLSGYHGDVHVYPPTSFRSHSLGSIIDVPVEHNPGKVAFWPKDGKDVWGPDSMLTDYWAVIAQEEQVHHDSRKLPAGVLLVLLSRECTARFVEDC